MLKSGSKNDGVNSDMAHSGVAIIVTVLARSGFVAVRILHQRQSEQERTSGDTLQRRANLMSIFE